MLEESGVPVYTIAISQQHFLGLGTLVDLSRWSGGLTFIPVNDGETRDMFTQIALTLRSQYAIGFYPTDAWERKPWHKVGVNLVNVPKALGRLGVFCRSGYPGFEN